MHAIISEDAPIAHGKLSCQTYAFVLRRKSKEEKGRCILLRVFNRIMRIISSLIGVLMVLMGGVWFLQGIDLAWGALRRSFMEGNRQWAFYGGIVVAIGVCQVIWSNIRQNIT
jgi:hypothetical protein